MPKPKGEVGGSAKETCSSLKSYGRPADTSSTASSRRSRRWG
jgi:hypothetical protein